MTGAGDGLPSTEVEDLRDEAAEVWELLYALLDRAEAADDAGLAAPLLDAQGAMERLLRAPAAEVERAWRRHPVTGGDVAKLECRLEKLAAAPGWADVDGAAPLLATVCEQVRHVAAVLADRTPDADSATPPPPS